MVAGLKWRRIVPFLLLLVVALEVAPRVIDAPQAAAAEKSETLDTEPAMQLPTIEETQQRLAAVAESTDLTPELKTQLTEELEKLVETLKNLGEARNRRKKSEEQAATAPEELKKVQDELKRTPPPAPQVHLGTPLEEVRRLKSEQEAELATAKKNRSEIQIEITDRKTRRAQSPQMVAELRAELQSLESEVPPEADDKTDPRLIITRRIMRAARIELIRERLAMHQQDQRTAESIEELLPLRLQVYDRDVARLEKVIAGLTQAVSSRREIKVEEALRAHEKHLLAMGCDPAVSQVLRLGATWTDLVKKHGVTQREKIEEEARAEKLATELSDTQRAIEADLARDGVLRSGLGLKLQRQRGQLPAVGKLQNQISAIDLEIEEMGSLQAQLEMLIEEMEGHDFSAARYPRSVAEDSVLAREITQLKEINRDIHKYILDLIELETHLDQIVETTNIFRSEIDSNVLWIRNAQPYALSDMGLAWTSFQEIMHPANLRSLGQAVIDQSLRRPDIVLLWIVASGLLIGFGSKLRRQVSAIGEIAAKRNQTSMRPTLAVIWRSGLLSLPLVVLFGIPGWWLTLDIQDSAYVQAVGNALMLIAAAVLPIELARQMVRRNGLAVLHFGLGEEHANVVRRTLRFAIDIGLPVMLIWGVAFNYGKASSASLARPLFFCGTGLVAFVLWRVMHPQTGMMAAVIEKRYGGWLDRLRYVWHPAITAVPLILGGLCLTGYSYSSRQLAEQLYWTLWLVLGLVVIGGMMRRWVTTSRRRLILAQARQRASEAERRDGAPIDVAAESSGLDITEINAQTLRLIHAVLTLMTVVGLWWMWAPVLPAVKFLDGIALWNSGAVDAKGNEIPFTLANVLTSLPVILLTLVSVRNLPGLMETVLLQRLPLESGARYAIATLSSYAMLMIGIIVSANTFGLRWESIQWLVAALGVGLGFGLQEIFANFVSGVILLFEQPIRVGDVVTIDGTTGAVLRIRMRATTVINWDRQELIIPNKDLITGRLINWTLTDSTNRVVINVRVAYGSDTRKACELLEQICQDHVNVADDPAPVVAFDGFGESSLNLVARCYLKTIDVRVRTIHELNTEIHERFNEAGLEIPVPQRDLNIRMLPMGMEALEQDKKVA